MDYRDAVDHQLRGVSNVSAGPAPNCGDCLDCERPADPSGDWYDLAAEPSFSRSPCDACGSRFAGNRYPAHGWIERDGSETLLHLDVCGDCYIYIANGTEPETWSKFPAR